jgi:hypothetical protein
MKMTAGRPSWAIPLAISATETGLASGAQKREMPGGSIEQPQVSRKCGPEHGGSQAAVTANRSTNPNDWIRIQSAQPSDGDDDQRNKQTGPSEEATAPEKTSMESRIKDKLQIISLLLCLLNGGGFGARSNPWFYSPNNLPDNGRHAGGRIALGRLQFRKYPQRSFGTLRRILRMSWVSAPPSLQAPPRTRPPSLVLLSAQALPSLASPKLLSSRFA